MPRYKFPVGNNANPNGRPKRGKALAERIRVALGGPGAPRAIAQLLRLATKGESEAIQLAAIKELLDRGFGKAVQDVDVEFRGVQVTGVVDLSRLGDEELDAIIALDAKARGITADELAAEEERELNDVEETRQALMPSEHRQTDTHDDD